MLDSSSLGMRLLQRCNAGAVENIQEFLSPAG
jgi:hypothetical protein